MFDKDDDGYYHICASDADCNDDDFNINPGAVEVCDDNIDNDCDGLVEMIQTV